MWGLTFYSLVENTCMTSSFTKKEFCAHKTYYIYMDVACFCDNSIWFWNCSNNVVFFVFNFIIYILPFFHFFCDWLMMICLHFWVSSLAPGLSRSKLLFSYLCYVCCNMHYFPLIFFMVYIPECKQQLWSKLLFV